MFPVTDVNFLKTSSTKQQDKFIGKLDWLILYSSNVVLVTQSCLTLCDPTDCSPPGISVHGVLQARILEWVVFLSPEDVPNPAIEPGSPA